MSTRGRFAALAAMAAVIAAGALWSGTGHGTAQGPGPTTGHQLAGNLISPRGMKMGPDGMIYVAEAGTAGDINAGSGDSASKSGFTGRISKINPATGARTTVADKLPSNGGPEGDTVGPADVAFLGSQLYYIQTHGGAAYGFPSNPTGLYSVNTTNGTVTLVADIGAYNIAHPVADISGGTQQDIEVGGNPYAMTVRDGAFFITDGNQNQIMKITAAGVITRLNEFPGHPVTTGITYTGNGPFYVTTLGQFPFSPADGSVRQVGYPSGTLSTVASGISSLTDVEFGPGGQLYALNFADQATAPNGPPWTPFTGKLMKVDVSTGTFTPVVSGFTATTAVIFSGDKAYISNNSVPFLGPGEIWEVDGVSALAPLAVTPTAAPTTAPPPPAATATSRTGVVAPNTGSGPDGGSGSMWIIAVIGGIGVLAFAAGITRRQMR